MSRPVVRQIWSPQDSIDTAQAFHLELHNAERGVSESQSRTGFGNRLMFSQSRERRARRMDALAVALLMIVMAAFGVIVMLLSTPQAKADPATEAYADIWKTTGPLPITGRESGTTGSLEPHTSEFKPLRVECWCVGWTGLSEELRASFTLANQTFLSVFTSRKLCVRSVTSD